MSRKKQRRGGRVTPKGTQDPGARTHERHHHELEVAPALPRELEHRLHEQRGAPPRPVSHNRGNR